MSDGATNSGGYDDGYKACSCLWGTEPGSLLLRLQTQAQIAGSKALDIGCGEGKNARFLAQAGAEVEALDISSFAIATAQKIASHPNIRYSIADIRSYALEHRQYDIVVMYGLIHCLSSTEEITDIILRLKTATRTHGWHILAAYNDRHQELSAHPGFEPILMAHADILALYDDWTITYASDEDMVETHPHNMIEHSHSFTRLLAQKN